MGEVFLAVVVLAPFWLAYSVSDRFHVAVRRMLGGKRVYIKGVSSAIGGERWVSIAQEDPWGDLFAYRYPATKTGIVKLNSDGTGEYHGLSVVWRAA